MNHRSGLTIAERDNEVLCNLDKVEWLTPLEIGAYNGSYHSESLARLIRKGLAERKVRDTFGNVLGINRARKSYCYRKVQQA